MDGTRMGHNSGAPETLTAASADVPSLLRRVGQFGHVIRRVTANGLNPLDVRIDEVLGPVEARIGGRHTLMFGTNGYLGLNFHPDCIAAANAATKAYGTGSTASRVASGNQALHEALEADIATFYGRSDAIVFSTGFMANLGVIAGLAREGDSILADALCHASIFDACKLSGARVRTFRHNDADDLRRQLDDPTIVGPRTLVVLEGVYSVWGDVADLPPLVAAAKDAGALILVDEAHALGTYGPGARGVAELQGVEDDVDVIVGTFSKSVGVIGGFCVSNAPELRGLRFAARSYLYTASLPPAIVAVARTAIGLITDGADLRARVWRNARQFHAGLCGLGFELCAEPGPVGSIRLPSVRYGLGFWRALLEAGIYVNMMVPPATPGGDVVLRFSVSAAHTDAHISTALATFERVAAEMQKI